MPPRGRGRGRGRGRRPMNATLRAALRDLGITNTSEYLSGQFDVNGAAVDAARANYPPFPNAPIAKKPTIPEQTMISRARSIQAALEAHPARADPPVEKSTSSLAAQLAQMESIVFGDCSSKKASKKEKSDPYCVVEMLPIELRPAKRRRAALKQEDTTGVKLEPKLGTIIQNAAADASDDDVGDGDKEFEKAGEQVVDGGDGQNDENEEIEEDPEGDYFTLGQADDDEGYEEKDSGDEQPVIG